MKKRILVLATGEKTVELGGGSGFQEMVEFSRTNPRIHRQIYLRKEKDDGDNSLL